MTTPIENRERLAGHDDGFSLIEVIVALAVLALLMSMLPGTVRLAHRSWLTIGDITRADERTAARTFLEQRLAEVMPVLVVRNDGAREPAFRGETHKLSFATPSASGPAGGGLYHMTLTAATTREGSELVLGQRLLAGGAASSRDGETRVLAMVSGELRFRYFGRLPDTEGRRWHDAWHDPERLPELVEIATQVEARQPLLAAFPPLVVALKLRRFP